MLKNHVVFPANENSLSRNWTNINHIMKLDVKWKPGNTSQMIELLYEITKRDGIVFRMTIGES